MHLPAEEIAESLIAVGQLTPVELDALTGQDDVRGVVDTLVDLGRAVRARRCARRCREYVAIGRPLGAGARARQLLLPVGRGAAARTAARTTSSRATVLGVADRRDRTC